MVGNKIKELRKKHKMSQSELGSLLGLSYTAIGYYESGKRRVPVAILKKMSEIFNVDMNELMGLNPPDDVLNGDEKAVLELFRQATPYQQEMILRMLDAAVSPKEST